MIKLSSKGFTLIESLLVLALISLALVFFSWRSWPGLEASLDQRLFFDQLQSQLQLAQEEAILQETAVTVGFWPQAQEIRIQSQKQGQGLQRLAVPDSLQLVTSHQLVYRATGRASGALTVYFQDLIQDRPVRLKIQLANGQFDITY
ncbi:competence type IV pilus minor pilin ComGD [Hutsoniella sourekii]